VLTERLVNEGESMLEYWLDWEDDCGELTCWLISKVTTPLEFTRAMMFKVTPVLWLLMF
jgi:hypothetical protein